MAGFAINQFWAGQAGPFGIDGEWAIQVKNCHLSTLWPPGPPAPEVMPDKMSMGAGFGRPRNRDKDIGSSQLSSGLAAWYCRD